MRGASIKDSRNLHPKFGCEFIGNPPSLAATHERRYAGGASSLKTFLYPKPNLNPNLNHNHNPNQP